jgi:hypothetical protein
VWLLVEEWNLFLQILCLLRMVKNFGLTASRPLFWVSVSEAGYACLQAKGLVIETASSIESIRLGPPAPFFLKAEPDLFFEIITQVTDNLQGTKPDLTKGFM